MAKEAFEADDDSAGVRAGIVRFGRILLDPKLRRVVLDPPAVTIRKPAAAKKGD